MSRKIVRIALLAALLLALVGLGVHILHKEALAVVPYTVHVRAWDGLGLVDVVDGWVEISCPIGQEPPLASGFTDGNGEFTFLADDWFGEEWGGHYECLPETEPQTEPMEDWGRQDATYNEMTIEVEVAE